MGSEPQGLSSYSDRELVWRSQAGDTDAFGLLVTRHQDRIFNAVVRFCGNAEDAQDITQRAFVNAFRKIREFKGESAFTTWMYRIAFNQAVSFLRESRRQGLPAGSGSGMEPVDDRRPGDRIESEENRAKVQEALNRLSSDDRRIIILKELEDRSYDQIAEVLRVPVGTVRSRLFRARQALKQELKLVIGTSP
ncbi:MAG: sigma-70 family RNA polymerase sigma factor [Planctomycetes bacterium]|nr:sigma-70 family RNA polymerase sigma factor [Planctomycetota bacterium]